MNQQQALRPAFAKSLLSYLSVGLLIGVLQVIIAVSFAALIFSGELAPYVSQGISIALLGMVIIAVTLAAYSSQPGMIGGSQDVPVAITAVMAAAVTTRIPSGASSPESFITVVAAIAIVTLSTGIFFWVIGRFQLGALVRFLPYPVAGGFLAATGWLLLTGSIDMMSGFPVTFDNLVFLFQPETLAYWLPGLLLAMILFISSRRSSHFLVLPLSLAGALLIFFIFSWINGFTLGELEAGGWVLSNTPLGETASLPPLSLALLGQINWPVIAGQAANIMAIIAVSAISQLLNSQGLELAIDQDLRVNYELQVAGAANLLAGLAGGLVGFNQLSLSILNIKLVGKSRVPGIIAAGVCLLVLFTSTALINFFPKFIIGSLLLYLGINFLYEWVIEGFFKLPRIDYAIVLVILFVTMSVGFLEAVGLGLLLAVVLFVVSYSQIDVVLHEMNAATFRSRVARSRQQEKMLTTHGQDVFILQLQGFVFFGTANNLLMRLRQRIYDPTQAKPDYIVLDFKRVSGLDSTGLLSFKRMKQLAQKEEIILLLTEPNGRVFDQLIKDGLNDDGRLVRIFPRLDLGAEWYENRILAATGAVVDKQAPLEQQLRETLFSTDDDAQKEKKIRSLIGHFERLEITSGQALIRMGDAPDNLYFIESGQLTAQLNIPGQAPLRLETSGSGNVYGEIGFYLGKERTADVVAETSCVLYRLSLDDLRKLDQTEPEAASTLHQIVAYLLADRMFNKTISIRSLET